MCYKVHMTPTADSDSDRPLDPAVMLALLESQQLEVRRRLAAFVPWILGAWGVAWLVGFGLLWLIDGARPALHVPLPVAAVVFTVLIAGAIVVSAVLGARSGRGIRSAPDAQFTGTVFGVVGGGWFLSAGAFASALVVNGMPPELLNIFYPTMSGLIVGFMYALAGGIWRIPAAIALGAWVVVVALVAPFIGYPNHYLVFALAGGGMFLVAAVITALSPRVAGARG